MADDIPAGHEQQCMTCWFTALGIDLHVGVAIVGAALKVGRISAMAEFSGQLAQAEARSGIVIISPELAGAVVNMARSSLAMPASPDVAEAMRSDHG